MNRILYIILRSTDSTCRVWLQCWLCALWAVESAVLGGCPLAFTRYSFTCRRLCTNQSSFHSSGPPALPTLLQYYYTIIGQYTTPPSTSLLYAIVSSFVHESIVLAFFWLSCIAHTVALLLHDYWAIYDPPLDLPFVCHAPYQIGNNNIV